jgi:hypothetical protein
MTEAALSKEITDLKEQTERDTCKRLAAKVGLFVRLKPYSDTEVLCFTTSKCVPTLGSSELRRWHRSFANWTEASVFLMQVAELFGGPEFPWGLSRHPDLESLQLREQVLRLEGMVPELEANG